jgi:hypothetical protein
LARIDALEPKAKAPTELPSKDSMFGHLCDLFVSSPERWTRVRVGWTGWDDVYSYDRRDGWVLDFKTGEHRLGFYRTGFFGIRTGFLRCGDTGRAERRDAHEWVYVFCPGFRLTIRRRRNWRLLKDLGGE